MQVAQQILNAILAPSKAVETVTNTVAGAGVAQVILPPGWWPTEESLTHNMAILYLGISILWIAVQIGFKFFQNSRED